MDIVRQTFLPSLGYLDRIEVCLQVEGQDLSVEVLSKDGAKSIVALSAILDAATKVGQQDEKRKVVVTLAPDATSDIFYVSPADLRDGLCR